MILLAYIELWIYFWTYMQQMQFLPRQTGDHPRFKMHFKRIYLWMLLSFMVSLFFHFKSDRITMYIYSDTEAQRTHWQQPANTVIAIRMEISCDKHWQQRLVSSGKQDRLSTTEYSQWFITNQGWRYVALLYILLCKSYCVHLRISFCLQKRRSDLIANWINNISLYWTFS